MTLWTTHVDDLGGSIMGKRNTNLIRRNGTYYIRCRVPKEHQSTIGKKEIILSLLTKDFGEARLLCSNIHYQILLGFKNMADKKDNKKSEPHIFVPTRDENGELKWWGGATEVGIPTELAIKNSARVQQPRSNPPAPDQSTLHPDAGKP